MYSGVELIVDVRTSEATGDIVATITEKHTALLHLNYVKEGVRQLVNAFKTCVRLRDKLVIHRQYAFAMQ